MLVLALGAFAWILTAAHPELMHDWRVLVALLVVAWFASDAQRKFDDARRIIGAMFGKIGP